MTQQTYTPADIVKFALSKDAVNIATAFDQLAGQKVVDAVQARKIEIAKHILGDAAPEEETTEVDTQATDEVETEVEAEESIEGETVAVEDEENQESEESHENAEQSA